MTTLLQRIRPVLGLPHVGPAFDRGVAYHAEGRYLKALGFWKQASAQGHAEAQYRIGLLYVRGEGVVRSMPDAVAWYKRAAETGHAEASYQLGLIYLNGGGAVRAPGSPEFWLWAASDHDDAAARQTLKLLFPNGMADRKGSAGGVSLDEGCGGSRQAGGEGTPRRNVPVGTRMRAGL